MVGQWANTVVLCASLRGNAWQIVGKHRTVGKAGRWTGTQTLQTAPHPSELRTELIAAGYHCTSGRIDEPRRTGLEMWERTKGTTP